MFRGVPLLVILGACACLAAPADETVRGDAQGDTVVTVRDPADGSTLAATYSLDGAIRRLEARARGGALRQVRVLEPDAIVTESFVPRHERLTARPALDARGSAGFEVEHELSTDDADSSPVRLRYFVARDRAGAEACLRPETPAQWNAIADTLSKVSLSARTPSDEYVCVGSNLCVRKTCKDFNGGIDGLAKTLEKSVRDGMACLMSIPGAPRVDGAALTRFFDKRYAKPVKLECGRPADSKNWPPGSPGKHDFVVDSSEVRALASFPTEKSFPSMQVNLDVFSKEDKNAPRTIFHEMLHWLGYQHGVGVD
ncbi:MAG: hypothetical protein HY075_09000, partial [Deltaproteobacteria bacterium]|nr:hypothetical protein [Deltaproteobacteria bacterium]